MIGTTCKKWLEISTFTSQLKPQRLINAAVLGNCSYVDYNTFGQYEYGCTFIFFYDVWYSVVSYFKAFWTGCCWKWEFIFRQHTRLNKISKKKKKKERQKKSPNDLRVPTATRVLISNCENLFFFPKRCSCSDTVPLCRSSITTHCFSTGWALARYQCGWIKHGRAS